jgi:hypothetical protein
MQEFHNLMYINENMWLGRGDLTIRTMRKVANNPRVRKRVNFIPPINTQIKRFDNLASF